MRNGNCRDVVWRINVIGKPCGVPVTDRDTIRLVMDHTGLYLWIEVEVRWLDSIIAYPRLVIFRSDVRQDHYYSLLPCHS